LKAEKWIQRLIKIPSAYNSRERQAIASDIVDYLRDRTEQGRGEGGKSWAGSAGRYSKSYKESLRYQIAGKSDTVNLTLSGDMLDMLRLVDDDKGALVIGFEPGDAEAGKAEGNIRGSYGQPKGNRSKARDFLAISRDELKKILSNYPLDDKEAREENVELRELADQAAEDFSDSVETDDLEEET
jgi:hypothetical protein